MLSRSTAETMMGGVLAVGRDVDIGDLASIRRRLSVTTLEMTIVAYWLADPGAVVARGAER
ncbi:hypothetical protein [Natronococcus sp. A-GB7]|uniref:hypothetical protein n=1 Tax=Natronococcus sp. A-GB7 TaxID=3037649 RepID=UPI0024200BC4|nr:hypothetical protein [Natronococcus sp. A-GB7]MDG5818252.1 hypothetical protein [Natronococcus sp. A-GB7]